MKKKMLVTGADGFIGSHLTEELLNQGYEVKALTYYNSFNYWGWLDNLKHPNLEVISGDIRDPHFCKHITKNIDIIFHLVALIAIPYSYVAPDSYVDTNVRGTLNICQSAKENGVGRVLSTSTSEVYGPRQSARAIIPTIITQIANGIKEIKLGDLTPTRDFNYVKDICKGFIELSKCDQAIGQEVNIASNYEISMRDTLNLIAKLMNADLFTNIDYEDFFLHFHRNNADMSVATVPYSGRFGWVTPYVSLCA